MFKVNNKNTKTSLFWENIDVVLVFLLLTLNLVTPFSSVSIVEYVAPFSSVSIENK